MADAMTECLRILIGRGVVRADQLEIVLLLAGEPERGWATHAVAEGILSRAEDVAPLLHGLASCGLLTVALDEPNEDVYRLDGRLDIGALQALRTTYARDRTRVTEALRRGRILEYCDPVPPTAWRSI